MRVASFVAFVVAVFMWSGNASASNCARDNYDHNGSLMEIEVCDGGSIVIAYDRPRAGMRRQGVRSGTLLFEGRSNDGIHVSGTARVFKRGCGPATYRVSGRWSNDGNRLVMRGRAPVRRGGCAIRRYRNDRLVFDLQ